MAKWGDAEFDPNFNIGDSSHESYETEPDETGVKTRVEWKVNEKGETIKVTKKIRINKKTKKVSKSVLERRKWAKFGDCEGYPRGPQPGETAEADEITMELCDKPKKPKTVDADTESLGIICRFCGAVGDHWSLKCPVRHKYEVPGGDDDDGRVIGLGKIRRQALIREQDANMASPAPGGGDSKFRQSGNSYVIPVRRPGASERDQEEATVRVSNLSEETEERDISDLFQPYGQIKRIFLAKDKVSGLAKGFAFVNYYFRQDAERAIAALDGHGFMNLIMHVEWARPSNRD